MFVFNQETILEILKNNPEFWGQGVSVVSYGKPRDAFQLSIDVPHWVSGYGGKYEMRHTNVPAGVMIAVGNLEELDVNNFEKLKAQLKEVDIYPTGHSGDFTGTDLDTLRKWFTDRSRLDNEVNPQTPIAHVKTLTKDGLGEQKFTELVDYLADNMNLFKDPGAEGIFVPADREQRMHIATALLDGISKTVRYTRMDDPAVAYQISGQVLIEKGDDSTIHLHMVEENKILIIRKEKNGLWHITPLDRAMLGQTWVTEDGEPLGNRGEVDISRIMQLGQEIENKGNPRAPLPFLRTPGPQQSVSAPLLAPA
jgi:hypothetical protein